MRKKIIIGNWKMHKTVAETTLFIEQFNQNILAKKINCDYGIAASFTNLSQLKLLVKPPFIIAAQNCHWANEGAMTGEISTTMLAEFQVQYIIIGHSERRKYFHETDEMINQKLIQIFNHSNMTPILCCGETLAEMENQKTSEVIKTQITSGLLKLTNQQISKLVIAYEPVWAIGTGKTATAEQAQSACHTIRQLIATITDEQTANQVRIQYGGSVKAENIQIFLSQPDIDGALVGGAALKVDEFINLLK